MSRPWGKQAVRSVVKERDIERLIKDFLSWRGWEVRKTDAIRGVRGKQIGEAGQADWICLRPTDRIGTVHMFFAELKGPMATTKKARLEKQAAWAERMAGRDAPEFGDQDAWRDFIADAVEAFEALGDMIEEYQDWMRRDRSA